MIRQRILGISLASRAERRRFVFGFWILEAAALVLLFRLPLPPRGWREFVPMLLVLAIANNLPLLLGGFSVGGAVSFYEGSRRRVHSAAAQTVAGNSGRSRRMQKLLDAIRPGDERELQIRDWAYRRAHKLMFWAAYAGTVTFLAISAVSLTALAHFGFVLLDLLLVASLSLPQSFILWNEEEFSGSSDGVVTASGAAQ